MPDLTQLASWAQILSLPIAIIAILVSLWVYHRSKQRRALICEFDPIVSPLEIKAGEAIEGDIEIRYKGQAVKNLFLVRAKLKNTGNIAIRQQDVIEPITFTFGLNTELIRSPNFLEKTPENLKIGWSFPPQPTRYEITHIILTFDLLNPGDEFTVELLCTGETTVPKVNARIEGVNKIEIRDPEEVFLRERARLALSVIKIIICLLLFGLVASILLIVWDPLNNLSPDIVMPPLVVLVMMFLPVLVFTLFFPIQSIFSLIRYQGRRGRS